MKISQILNNNVAVVKKGGSELIVYSKGISFRKKAGQSIGEDEIEKTYVLDSK
uniref:CAT RNA binding domain-containing protein n=1 Tax=Enterocloster aldenensis TaxID=358742 RepID=UPI00336A9475